LNHAAYGIIIRSINASDSQNGRLCLLTRSLDALPLDGRPLSKSPGALREMWRVREPFYRGAADFTIENDAAPDIVAARAEEAYHEAVDR
jgi:shikimate dehydrogenase